MAAGSVSAPTIVPLRSPWNLKQKSLIDESTKIELKSETPGTRIFYTTDGSRPEPFEHTSSNTTVKYKQPFTLRAGKRTLKALAVSSDNERSSNVVTKTFDVEQGESDGGEAAEDDETAFVSDLRAHRTAPPAGGDKLMRRLIDEAAKYKYHKPRAEARFLGQRFAPKQDAATSARRSASPNRDTVDTLDLAHNGHVVREVRRAPVKMPAENSLFSLKLQRQSDFLKCINCNAPRPMDPFMRFCSECGSAIPPLPEARLPAAAAGELGTCLYCHSTVPLTLPKCLVCEAPIAPQLQPQATIRLEPNLLCPVCNTANPSNVSSCLACEARLPKNARPVLKGSSAPPLPNTTHAPRLCHNCGRMTTADARFCDWCGLRPSSSTAKITCSKCQAANGPYSQYCGSCGVHIAAPLRMDLMQSLHDTVTALSSSNKGQPAGLLETLSLLQQQQMAEGGASSQWAESTRATLSALGLTNAPASPDARRRRQSVGCQTVGLFYPSQRDLIKKRQQEDEQWAFERQLRDRQPLLTAVSPGKGFWRKQIEHICTLLRMRAQNDPDFRVLIGQPRMGKILSTSVLENGYELNLSVTFQLHEGSDPFRRRDVRVQEQAGGASNGVAVRSSSGRAALPQSGSSEEEVADEAQLLVEEDDESEDDDVAEELESRARSAPSRQRPASAKKKHPKPKRPPAPKLPPEDRKLLAELEKGERCDVELVQRLLEQGANANVINPKTGQPAGMCAVQNRAVYALPLLVQLGKFDVNAPVGAKGNTALHEAVALGRGGLDTVKMLLDLGASVKKKNVKGETPYDMAMRLGYDDVGAVLLGNIGHNQLSKLMRSRQM